MIRCRIFGHRWELHPHRPPPIHQCRRCKGEAWGYIAGEGLYGQPPRGTKLGLDITPAPRDPAPVDRTDEGWDF